MGLAGGRYSAAAYQGKDADFVTVAEGHLKVGPGDAVDEDDFGVGEFEMFEQPGQGRRIG